MINPASASAPALVAAAPTTAAGKSTSGTDGFQRIVDELIGGSARADARADAAVLDVALGRSDDVAGAALAVGMADLSFRRVLEMRNKLLDAYQEVMRMQV